MRKLLVLLLVLGTLFSTGIASAQTTTVTATVVDANANPYALGTVSAQIVAPTGIANPTLNGLPVPISTSPALLDAAGHFSIVLPDNLAVVPAGTQYTFKVCASPVNIGPLGNQTPTQVCFAAGPYVITGASVDLSVQLNARSALLGPAQGTSAGGGSPPAGNVQSLQFRLSLIAFGGSNLNYLPLGNPVTGGSYLTTNDDLFGLNLSATGDSFTSNFSHASAKWADGVGHSVIIDSSGVTLPSFVIGHCVNVSAGHQLQDSGAPCAGGSLISSNNVWTGLNQFNQNVSFKGPNPYYDLSAWGLYAGTGAAITCSTAAASNSVPCAGVGDFAIGQGIAIPLAGPAPTFDAWGVANLTNFARFSNVATYCTTGMILGSGQSVTIAGLSDGTFNGVFAVTGYTQGTNCFTAANAGGNVTTTGGAGTATVAAPLIIGSAGILNGVTTYAYKVVMGDVNGALSVASPAVTLTTGAANLGVNTVALTGCSRTSSLTTCTTSATHNFQTSVLVDLAGMTGISSATYNGQHKIVATPTASTFTFYQYGFANDTGNATGGNALVVAKNVIQWNMEQGKQLQAYVYRSKSGGAYSLAGTVGGMDGAFVDWGIGAPLVPWYVPAAPPGAPANGLLATTITGIAGTTLTLATPATATATSQLAQHDNSPVVAAACASMAVGVGGTLYVPSNGLTFAPFRSPLNLPVVCSTLNEVTLHLATQVNFDAPLIWKKGFKIEGTPGGPGPFPVSSSGNQSFITGISNPLIYFPPASFGPSELSEVLIGSIANNFYQSALLTDQDSGGLGSTSINFHNVYFLGNEGAIPLILRGGFDYWFDRGGVAVNGTDWGYPEGTEFNLGNSIGIRYQGWGGITVFDKTAWQGRGISYNNWGVSAFVNNPSEMTFNTTVTENLVGSFITMDQISSNVDFDRVILSHLTIADPLSGTSTPALQLTGSNAPTGILSIFTSCVALAPLIEGFNVPGLEMWSAQGGSCNPGTNTFISHLLGRNNNVSVTYSNVPIKMVGTGDAGAEPAQIFYPMDIPVAPASAVVSAGGSVPVNTWSYAITAFDNNGGESGVGPGISTSTTGGNQTVTVTRPTLPTNAVAWVVYRYPTADSSAISRVGICSSIPIGTTTFVDTFAVQCGTSPPAFPAAGKVTLGSSGVSSFQITGNQTDFIKQAAPANPPTGFCRAYLDSTSGLLTVLTSTGGNCLSQALPALPIHPATVPWTLTTTPSGGVGGAPAFLLAGVPVDFITAASYAIVGADRGHRKSFSNAGAVAVALPQAGTGAGTDADFTSNFVMVLRNYGAGTVTVTAAGGSTFDHSGATTLAIITGKTCFIWSDNTNYESGCF